MTRTELITILELYKIGRWGLDSVLSAVDAYSSTSNGSKPIVSGSLHDEKIYKIIAAVHEEHRKHRDSFTGFMHGNSKIYKMKTDDEIINDVFSNDR